MRSANAPRPPSQRARALALGLSLLLPVLPVLPACKASEATGYDPIEGTNRKLFAFNEGADRYVLEPIAIGWDWVLPDGVQRSISRFFDNLAFPVNFVNNLLQGKPRRAGTETVRFVVNTTVGIVGLFDPATRFGVEAHPEDLGQTLGTYGVRPGAYLVIPLLGPSNPRDLVGRVGDAALSLGVLFVGAFFVDVVNDRGLRLEDIREARAASLDFYVFVRNAYNQRRRTLIADGLDTGQSAEDLYDEDDLYYSNDDDLYFPDEDDGAPQP